MTMRRPGISVSGITRYKRNLQITDPKLPPVLESPDPADDWSAGIGNCESPVQVSPTLLFRPFKPPVPSLDAVPNTFSAGNRHLSRKSAATGETSCRPRLFSSRRVCHEITGMPSGVSATDFLSLALLSMASASPWT